jgi:glycine dehydrogenase
MKFKDGGPVGEFDALEEIRAISKLNEVKKSFIGQGYYGTLMPNVLLRNVLENPSWYTPYTPYQAEIAQGRLEMLINYQTMVKDLTGMHISNASLLDEATALAEGMFICFNAAKKRSSSSIFLIDSQVFPQNVDVCRTRAEPLGIEIVHADVGSWDFEAKPVFGVALQYPDNSGTIRDYQSLCKEVQATGGRVVVAADVLALTLLKPPGEWGADICVGSTQRFGIPMGYGGPHAGYMAVSEPLTRLMPGRLIGVSKDRRGKQAYRMALQTREQHIKREKATSNICTAQALLANLSAMYAIYHGPAGLVDIAQRTHGRTLVLAEGLRQGGCTVSEAGPFFDTVVVEVANPDYVLQDAAARGYNLRRHSERTVGISLDETTSAQDIATLWEVLMGPKVDITPESVAAQLEGAMNGIPANLRRTSPFLTHPTFNRYHSETDMMRYLKHLSDKDLGLDISMIPLGSCTMKLNAAAEMIPVTWPEFGNMHPMAPTDQTRGYQMLIDSLSSKLCELTGFDGITFQPNSGAQGEYSGLLAIRAYQRSIGQDHRNVCLIPVSAHGTNPASAMLANMKIVTVKTTPKTGDVDLDDFRAKVELHRDKLSALMITYPSTYGVFEEGIVDICDMVHEAGGQVYMDGANLNAQMGLTSPGFIGADVCHLNLHKTFCIPHGGGGPGVGPIAVAKHLIPFLPDHVSHPGCGGASGSVGAVSGAPFGSASILPISWMYVRMLGAEGLTYSAKISILSANYLATRLKDHYDVVYTGKSGYCAHEFILDASKWKKSHNIQAEDIAKRLADFGFHAPTLSFPIVNTLMSEPTESESKETLDRYVEALIHIRKEIQMVIDGTFSVEDNPLTNAPHCLDSITSDEWTHSYSREVAAYPLPWVKERKFWPTVSRINSTYGDLNLICSCPPIESYEN